MGDQDCDVVAKKTKGKGDKLNTTAFFQHYVVQRTKNNGLWLRFRSFDFRTFETSIRKWEEALRDTQKKEISENSDSPTGWRNNAQLGFATIFLSFPVNLGLCHGQLSFLQDNGYSAQRIQERIYE